jgi:hypothetical protein
VARILQIGRRAIYRVPKPRRTRASPSRPPVDEVEAAIVAEADANPTDGYRLVTAWVRRRLRRRVNAHRPRRVSPHPDQKRCEPALERSPCGFCTSRRSSSGGRRRAWQLRRRARLRLADAGSDVGLPLVGTVHSSASPDTSSRRQQGGASGGCNGGARGAGGPDPRDRMKHASTPRRPWPARGGER